MWDKQNGANDFADCELAWTNLDTAVRRKQHLWNGMMRKGREARHHPTQKPLDVMMWCLSVAGEDARRVVDPFAGSGTVGVACVRAGRTVTLVEREERYCEVAARRIEAEESQLDLFPAV